MSAIAGPLSCLPLRRAARTTAGTQTFALRPRRVMRAIGALLLALMLYSSSPSHANLPPGENALTKRGQELHKEIYAAYANMKVRGSQRSTLDLTALVAKYIPPGSSFENAEEVLRSAGCKVTSRTFTNHTRYLHPSDSTFASITLSGHFLSVTKFSAMLTPKAPGGSTVENIQATISTSYP
jgi:hypothetical protein